MGADASMADVERWRGRLYHPARASLPPRSAWGTFDAQVYAVACVLALSSGEPPHSVYSLRDDLVVVCTWYYGPSRVELSCGTGTLAARAYATRVPPRVLGTGYQWEFYPSSLPGIEAYRDVAAVVSTWTRLWQHRRALSRAATTP